MSAIIEVKDLSKSYTIRHEGAQRYTALRDVMATKAKKLFSFPKSLRPSLASTTTKEEFWALKDVSFDIEQGDRVGIIGRNGAGKSTLLKILSRITEPTSGSIKIRGRVASLLEVGTGFHPELTGRENIFLNGAILGMSRAEIRKHFDAIVDFAEIEKFLDTPVKRYSSGMYVRLAFAVAAHLEPEILVVDEVLAVGDAQFQKKCLGKMEDVSKHEGRTVLFVSHNFAAVRNLCENAIVLNNGQLAFLGNVDFALENYGNQSTLDPISFADYFKRNSIAIISFKLIKNNCVVTDICTGDDLSIHISFKSTENIYFEKISIGIAFEDRSGALILINYSEFYNKYYSGITVNVKLFFRKVPIGFGIYKIHLRITEKNQEIYWNRNICAITISNGDYYGTGKNGEDNICKNFHELRWD